MNSKTSISIRVEGRLPIRRRDLRIIPRSSVADSHYEER